MLAYCILVSRRVHDVCFSSGDSCSLGWSCLTRTRLPPVPPIRATPRTAVSPSTHNSSLTQALQYCGKAGGIGRRTTHNSIPQKSLRFLASLSDDLLAALAHSLDIAIVSHSLTVFLSLEDPSELWPILYEPRSLVRLFSKRGTKS